jgi:23S rRNA (guanine1835-N2)-methyltransferase
MKRSPTEIKRYPIRKNETLQGWDSADELLLEHIETLNLQNKRILIINDHFGAISCGLIGQNCQTYTDSYVSSQAIELNSHGQILPINNLKELQGPYDFVIFRGHPLPPNSLPAP